MRRIFLVLWIACWISNIQGQPNSKLLDSIIKANPGLKKIILEKSKYRPQIIYTQINRDADNKPAFKNHTYLLDSNNYFYCASLVKLPCSIFALEKLNELNRKDLTRSSIMLTDSAYTCQRKYWKDSSSLNGYPSIEHHIKKMLLVSDNNSFGRVFEFLNPNYIQAKMTKRGHPRARIVHRLEPACVGRGNTHFNPITFEDDSNRELYFQPADSLTEEFKPPFEKVVIGRDIYGRRKRLISEKKDFTKSNYLSLQMVHECLQDLVFNEFAPAGRQFNISRDDWQFLMKHLGMYPRESEWPAYDPKFYYDSFKKYFIYGSAVRTIEADSLRIFNIVGRAYGFEIDCAYIVDFRTKAEFMLSAVIYTNKQNSFGKGNYEYDTTGLPFLKELSLALYDFETRRIKKYLPNFENLEFYQKAK